MVNTYISSWVVGVREILYDPKGTTIATHAWGLITTSNNLAVAYALLKGIQLTKELRIKPFTVLGDSMVIIKAMLRALFW
jgi:ribonuclease HI